MALWLSLVFIYWENPRRSGILLFPDRPRFCQLMKTQSRKYPPSGMVGDKSRGSGAFLFSRGIPDFCDGQRSFKIYMYEFQFLMSGTSAIV